jgi:sporulation integral membrane protein YlbJ
VGIHSIRNKAVSGRRPGGAAGALGMGCTALLVGGLAMAMPDVALNASLRGVTVWWEVLFPALFPFFVLSELLLGFGIVHLAGTLLDPLMRPLFRLPGAGAFVVSMGLASGYPVGARLTSRLMEQKLVNREQGERLVEMTTTSDPIFLIGAVGVGFFGRPEAVPVLALAHYGGAMLLGLMGRWRSTKDYGKANSETKSDFVPSHSGGRLRSAIVSMHRARQADGRPFGVLLHQSMQSSLALMIIVGGLVVFFSAALDLLLYSGMLAPLRQALAWMIRTAGMPAELASSFIQGTFEVTLGARAAATASDAAGTLPLVDRLAAAAFVLSWAGLSVHAQVAGLMSRTGWRYGSFVRTRFLHGILAAALVYLVWPFFGSATATAVPAWLDVTAAPSFERVLWPPLMAAAVLAGLVTAGTAAMLIRGLRRRLEKK